ncbi:unnamed protein product [Calypogeia fissa]
MECGNMKNLSGILYGRGITNGSFPNRPPSPNVSALATPRRSSSSSSHATPRGSQTTPRGSLATPRDSHLTPRSSLVALKSIGVGCGVGLGLGGEDLIGPPRSWSPCPSERPLSPQTRQSPRITRRLVMASRDKESLMEEIIHLKKELAHQASVIRHKNAQNSRFGIQNRKLEMDVEDLETSLQLEGPRTGSPHRLRSKLQGLQTMVDELQDKCDSQQQEIMRLRRDLRVTRAREIEVERDVFAIEIKRLQKVVKRMQYLQNKINCENRDLGRLKNKFQQLEIANIRLESCMTARAIRPQSQPGTSRKRVHYDQDGRQLQTGKPPIDDRNSGQPKFRT